MVLFSFPNHQRCLAYFHVPIMGFPGAVKESACNAGTSGDMGSILSGEDPLGETLTPTPVFLTGETEGQRSRTGLHRVAESQTQRRSRHACISRLDTFRGQMSTWFLCPTFSWIGLFVVVIWLYEFFIYSGY